MFSLKTKPLLPFALLAVAAMTGMAQAQPDPNNVPKAQNPDNRPVRPNNRQQMTPEQREQAVKRYMKNQIERAGVTDEAQQDAALEYVQNELDAREDLQESSRALSTAMRNTTLTDAQIAGLLNTYMGDVEDDKARRTAAQKKLSDTIDMTKVPRLETMLVLMGAWGDAPAVGGNAWMGRGRNRGERGNNKPDKAVRKDKAVA